MTWPDMFDMHFEAKMAIDELNAATRTSVREMQFNASPNVGWGGNRRVEAFQGRFFWRP
jgi:hypothetical protein